MPHRPVRSVMQKAVVALRPDMSAREADRVLAEHRIGGAPVVDDAGRLAGVLSQSDLVRFDADPPSAAAGAFFTDVADYRDVGTQPLRPGAARVCDVMTRHVLAVPPDATVAEAARRMREHRVHRLLVLEDGTLRGVVTAFDLLGVLAAAAGEESPSSPA